MGASPSDCLVSYPGHSLRMVWPLCRDAVGVFYCSSWLSCISLGRETLYIFISFEVPKKWLLNVKLLLCNSFTVSQPQTNLINLPKPPTLFLLSCYNCSILTFDPAKHAIPKTAEVHIPLAWANLADNMGHGKIPRYTHRLMHRKRVTCELHDSYFRLMTIKHAIPKILSGRWNYYKIRWRQEVSEFGDPLVTRCSRESPYPAEWAPGPPVEQPWRTRKTQRWWP